MTTIGRRWMIAFALALTAHTAVFFYAGAWLGGAPRPLAPEVAPGGEPLELLLVAKAPPAEASAPAVPAPASPPTEAPREVRVEETPPAKPPEPVKEPEPKPVLTELVPEVPVALPVVAQVKPVERKDVVDKMDKAAPAGPNVSAGAAASGQGSPKADSNSSGLSGGSAPISTIHPRYPMGSRIRGEEGPVLLHTRVDTRGRPVEVAVLQSSGFFALDAAAVKAVKGARFVPPAPGSPPESYLAELTIRFQLKDP